MKEFAADKKAADFAPNNDQKGQRGKTTSPARDTGGGGSTWRVDVIEAARMGDEQALEDVYAAGPAAVELLYQDGAQGNGWGGGFVSHKPLPSKFASQFKASTDVDVSDVTIAENPKLEEQGKRGVAIEGRCVEVAPGGMEDAELVYHELVHIGQSILTSGIKGGEDVLENEAVDGAQTILSGQSFSVRHVSQRDVLFSDLSASTADEITSRIPDGPMAQLQAYLGQDDVPEEECLALIKLLGPGERRLVVLDEIMMRQMSNAFNEAEIMNAVTLLDCPIQTAIHWISEAGEEGGIDHKYLSKLIQSANSQDIADMIGREEVRGVFECSFQGTALTLGPLRKDASMMLKVIETHSAFTDWILRSDGVMGFIEYMIANDSQAIFAGLEATNKRDAVLDALQERSKTPRLMNATFEVFQAIQDSDLRQSLFGICFEHDSPELLDWTTDGEAHWQQVLEDQKDGLTEADVVSRIDQNLESDSVDSALVSEPDSSLVRLEQQLTSSGLDSTSALIQIKELNSVERHLLRNDGDRLRKLIGGFSANEVVQLLRYLDYPKPQSVIAILIESGAISCLSSEEWKELFFQYSADDLVMTFRVKSFLAAFIAHSGISPLCIPSLIDDDFAMSDALRLGEFADWVIAVDGELALLRNIAQDNPILCAESLDLNERIVVLLDALPEGVNLAPADKRALFIVYTSRSPGWFHEELTYLFFEKRFSIKLGTIEGSGKKIGFDELKDIWEYLEQVPDAHVAANRWLHSIVRSDDNSTAGKEGMSLPAGVTGLMDPDSDQGRIKLSYNEKIDPGGSSFVYGPETQGLGRRFDSDDVIANRQIFEHTVVHEVGHAADKDQRTKKSQLDRHPKKFTSLSGEFATNPAFGSWREYRTSKPSDVDQLFDDMLSGVPLEGYSGVENRNISDILDGWRLYVTKSESFPTPSVAFESLAEENKQPWQQGNHWFDLWKSVAKHPISSVILDGQATEFPWDNPVSPLGDRVFHEHTSGAWTSFLATLRQGVKLSYYAFRDKEEFFGEIYALFYSTPEEPGRLIRDWNRDIYEWFVVNVDQGFSTRVTPK